MDRLVCPRCGSEEIQYLTMLDIDVTEDEIHVACIVCHYRDGISEFIVEDEKVEEAS